MSENLPVTVRPAVASDLPFIRNSWLRNYHEHGPLSQVPNDVFFADAGHWGVVDRCLKVGVVLVAHPEGDDGAILGWLCGGPGATLNYTYVKAPFRKLGVARLLIERFGSIRYCTHWTPVIREWAKRGHAYTFNPYLLERA